MSSSSYDRSQVLELGLDVDDVAKAESHFGSSITVEKAIDWILNGCPGYNAHASSNNAVVPYTGSNNDNDNWQGLNPFLNEVQPQPDMKSAWDDDYVDPHSAAAKGLVGVREGGDLNAYGYAAHPKKEGDVFWDGNQNRQGTTGRTNTPVDGPGSSADHPIEIGGGQQETSMPPLVGHNQEDEDLQKALEMSKGDMGGQSQAMSRQPSDSAARQQQQEEDELAQALSMSVMDMGASGMSVQSAHGDADAEAALLETRADFDRPIALITPPSAFLSYFPNLIHCFHANVPFRNSLFAIQFFESTDPAILFANYARGTAKSTRKILAERWQSQEIPSAIILLAALQRLFAFVTLSKRSRTSLADFMDAVGLHDGSKAINVRMPTPDIKHLHEKICGAWATLVEGLISNKNDIVAYARLAPAEEADSTVDLDKMRTVLHWQGIQLGQGDLRYLQDDAPPDFIERNKQSVPFVDVSSYAPEVNDTYAALDSALVSLVQQTKSFLQTRSDSLYIFNTRIQRPAMAAVQPNPSGPVRSTVLPSIASDSPSARLPFQIAPTLYLDRYDWEQRRVVEGLREEAHIYAERMEKLARQQAKLGQYGKTGQDIVTPLATAQDDEASKAMDAGGRKKALLDKTLALLKTASESEEDEKRKAVQLELVQRLSAVAQTLQRQLGQLQDRLRELRSKQDALWQSLPSSVGPYELRSVLMWRGLPGRESTYVYLQSGTASVCLGTDVEAVEHRKWWRVTDTVVEEVSADTVLSDPTGMHMYNGGGSVLFGYTLAEKEKDGQRISVSEALAAAVQVDNAELDAAIAKKNAAQADELPGQDDAEMNGPDSQGAVTEGGDVHMGSESQSSASAAAVAPGLIVTESTSPLRLNGGSSSFPAPARRARRSSVTSDAGSVASTSKVQIGDDDEFDDESEGEDLVELGFAEQLNKKGFKIVKDVGKIGGKPTWLNPALPLRVEQTTCPVCGERMEYLMQINAPLDEIPGATYRTFYIYSCRRASCLSKDPRESVKVFRTQLPASNPFYEVERPEDQSLLQRFRDKQYLKFCQTCKMEHEQPCSLKPWQEWVIETGPEELDGPHDPVNADDLEVTMQHATLSSEIGTQDAREPDTKVPVDAAFLAFQERLRNEPDQVLRYYYRETADRAGPLWVSDEKTLKAEDVPNCKCGARRIVEFQILSTLLGKLGVNDLEKDSLDFGTIVVYTCEASCTSTPAPASSQLQEVEGGFQRYAPVTGWEEEVAFVQNYSDKGVDFR